MHFNKEDYNREAICMKLFQFLKTFLQLWTSEFLVYFESLAFVHCALLYFLLAGKLWAFNPKLGSLLQETADDCDWYPS